MAGIIETVVAEGLSRAWMLMSKDQCASVVASTMSTEMALHAFNEDVKDENISPEEFEDAVKLVLSAGDSVVGRAIQAFIWSLFKGV